MNNNHTSKEKIISDSQGFVSQNSFFSVSMQEIANYLNIRKSLLYYYFKNKTDLFCEVINGYFLSLNKKVEIIFSENLSASQKLDKLSRLYLKELENDKLLTLSNLEINKMDDSITKAIKSIHKFILDKFEFVINEGIEKGEFKSKDSKKTSLAITGYIEKINQHEMNLDNDWKKIFIK
jgi:AcrR family transcriptional regulator